MMKSRNDATRSTSNARWLSWYSPEASWSSPVADAKNHSLRRTIYQARNCWAGDACLFTGTKSKQARFIVVAIWAAMAAREIDDAASSGQCHTSRLARPYFSVIMPINESRSHREGDEANRHSSKIRASCDEPCHAERDEWAMKPNAAMTSK